MACYLRIFGENFEVDSFIAQSEWSDWPNGLVTIIRKGESFTWNKSKPHAESGLIVTASDSDFDDFSGQQAEAIQFLKDNTQSLKELLNYKLDWAQLDFGLDVWPANRFTKVFLLSSELVQLCAKYSLDVCMSNYFMRPDSPKKRGRAFRKLKAFKK